MGLFGSLGGSPFGRASTGQEPGRRAGPNMYTLLATGALAYLASNPRTLQNLLGKFQNRGLGNKVNSWVGMGANDPVRPDELEDALGPEDIDRIARQAGVSHAEAREVLAQVLPNLVDKLTPHGTVPPPNALNQGIDFLRNSLFRQ